MVEGSEPSPDCHPLPPRGGLSILTYTLVQNMFPEVNINNMGVSPHTELFK